MTTKLFFTVFDFLIMVSAFAQTWSTVGTGIGTGGSVSAFAVDSIHNILYVGGHFDTAGGVTVSSVAKWNGTSWSDVGNGVKWNGNMGDVNAMAFYNGELYVGGIFNLAGSTIVSGIARWNGSIWNT